MSLDRTSLLFFDASCLIAAAGSPNGGSGFLLSLCARHLLQAAVSQPVLLEAETNIRDKMSGALATYRRLLTETPMMLASVPTAASRQAERMIVGEKDDHVLAAALAIKAPFLLTLDKPLAQRVNAAGLPLIRAYAPGEFITKQLPTHVEYPSLRS